VDEAADAGGVTEKLVELEDGPKVASPE